MKRWMVAGLALLMSALHAEPLQPLLDQLRAHDLQRGAWAVQQGEQVQTARIEAGAIEPLRIGSISKLFTAVLALQLVEQGRLKLDDPIARWFPRLPDAAHTTVEMLLRHRSGLGDVKDAPDFERWARQPRTPAELQALIESFPRQFPPGTRRSYNNSAFILLHWIVERAGGASFDAQLAARITGPLGLRNTGLRDSPTTSYRWADEGWQPQAATDASVPLGAGAFVSTPAELTRFIRALFRGALLQPATLARMTTMQDGFGLGIAAAPPVPGATQALGHEGVIDGYRAALVYLPEQDVAAAVLLKAERWPRDALLQALLASRLQAGYTAPDLRPQRQHWTLQASVPLKSGERLALRGNQPPLSWQRGLAFDAQGQLTLSWMATPELPLEAKLVIEDAQGQVLRWEAGDNRQWRAGAAPGLLRFDVKGEVEQLWNELMAADRAMFEAFNRRDAAALGGFFSERLEFFHDRGGVSGKAQTMQNFTQNFARRDRVTRRELLPEGQQIYPVPGVGAMQIGRHRFCTREGDAPEGCSDYGFSTVWEKTAAGWQQLRVLSYGH